MKLGTTESWCVRAFLLTLGLLAAAQLLAAGQYFGAIFTTLVDGTSVDANIYTSKSDVYLNGGPQNTNSKGLPNGTYYFQVTDPSGAVLLSQDNAECRQLNVVNGVVAGATGPCPHANGVLNPANGSLPVQLMPFADTPNNGGEYKAWLIRQVAGTTIDTIDLRVLHFSNSDAKTDNFKVKPPDLPPPPTPVWPIQGKKFYDINKDGVQAATGEPGIRGWKFKVVGQSNPPVPDASGAPYDTTTDINGNFRFDGLTAGDTYGVCEIFPTANVGTKWRATPACANSFTAGGYPVNATTTAGVWDLPFPSTLNPGHSDAACNTPSNASYPAKAYYTNIADVFEFSYDISSSTFPVGWPAAVTTFPAAVFGNYCEHTPSGGLTLGFWSNANGANVLNAGTGGQKGITLINSLKDPANNALRYIDPNGNPIVFIGSLPCSTAAYTCFQYWLTHGSSSNAANQLSIQMTAADLNVVLGAVASTTGCGTKGNQPCEASGASYDEMIYAPGTQCAADASGNYATLGCVITEANYALGQNAATFSGSTATCNTGGTLGSVNCRSWEVSLQTALNGANNNIAVQPTSASQGVGLCGVNYNNSETCSVTVPLQITLPPAP